MRPGQKGASKIPPKRESQRELNAPLERSVPVPTRMHLDIRFWPGPDGSIGASHRAIGPSGPTGEHDSGAPISAAAKRLSLWRYPACIESSEVGSR
jgi:hypothetical protein